MKKRNDSIFSEDACVLIAREMKKIKHPAEDITKEYESEVIWTDDADEDEVEELFNEYSMNDKEI